MSRLPPHCPDFALLLKAPQILNLLRQLISKDLPRLRPHILISRRENNLVCRQLKSISGLYPMGQNLRDFLALLDLDLAIDNEL
jgi:hypothetical protein